MGSFKEAVIHSVCLHNPVVKGEKIFVPVTCAWIWGEGEVDERYN